MPQDVTVRDSVRAGKVIIRQGPPVVTRRDRINIVETELEQTIVILDQQEHKVLISSIGVQGPPGPPGASGDAHFEHVQSTPSAIWAVDHDLSKMHPSVTIIDALENVVYADIQYIDADTLWIIFTLPQTGKAYLN